MTTPTQTPGVYYLYWILFACAFTVTCSYCALFYRREKPKHESLALPIFLVCLVITLYSLNQFPEVQRHFDPVSNHFVDGYHEDLKVGFIKFLYKIGLGILLMIYGLMGRGRH